MTLPLEPPPSSWEMPDPDRADESGLVAIGADLAPGTILAAYRSGLFPMPVRWSRAPGWWSPDPRGIIPLEGLRVSRSLRKATERFEVRIDTEFDQVIDACGDPRRPHGWINRAIKDAYRDLHRRGWAHSVETWSADGELVGGLYGIAIGGLFAGESMFHRATDASKVALVGLVEALLAGGAELLDVQWKTDHLATLGAVEIPRSQYLELLPHAVRGPLPTAFQS
ncbi:leucyl/phenylalanyl-tRNA--protein transferase [Aquihabitans sp. McL0605]|uniref:leucyl/phenylalanyl-tRNA--protein transferase n=1 Tax=Aquihabitans sp. McL0605 TaxID=3415671 RepID=UPI003CEEE79F